MVSGIGSILSSISPQMIPASAGGNDAASSGFGDVFKAAVKQLDELQGSADEQVGKVLTGNGNADVGNVMASVEKADVAFQLMMQVRNKIVNAYQEIEKMQF